MEHFTLNFDGSCWPNPGGTAGYGYALSSQGSVIDSGHGVIGMGPGMTSNVAEFYALHKGLEAFSSRIGLPLLRMQFYGKSLQVYGDSNLVIQIMNRHWRPKREKAYYSAYERAAGVLTTLRKRGITVSFDWIPRERNTQCDDLSKAHLQK